LLVAWAAIVARRSSTTRHRRASPSPDEHPAHAFEREPVRVVGVGAEPVIESASGSQLLRDGS
jgi:hypothetical protein